MTHTLTDKALLAIEVPYLLHMLRADGTREVPAASMPGYLRLQASYARDANLHGLSIVLDDCADTLQRGAAADYAYRMLSEYVRGLNGENI